LGGVSLSAGVPAAGGCTALDGQGVMAVQRAASTRQCRATATLTARSAVWGPAASDPPAGPRMALAAWGWVGQGDSQEGHFHPLLI